ncbi:MAG TPA: SDR family NAD(P)-dependent oxidoreductase [Thermodesulfobacteriota bacterium]|nr:SDR family NAD(P)-dependent oxidoreductase [Thermodesulfobacteriota bacterium]
MNLQGKVTVMVGGEGPLGREVSKKFLSEGAKVFIGWFAQKEWEEAKELISTYKGQFADMQIDATKEDQVQKLMQKAKDTFGSLDVLLHMVGMVHIGPMVWETDAAILDRLLDTNLKSAFLCAKHAVKIMLEKKDGRIVFFPARVAAEPQPRFGAYAVSKAGLITLMQVLREELKETRITVNSVMPSVMDTFRTRHMPNPEPDKWVKPSEIAELLCGLCSDESGALSGSILKVFGKL